MYTTTISSVTASTEIDISKYQVISLQTSTEARFDSILGQVLSTGAWVTLGYKVTPTGFGIGAHVWRTSTILTIDVTTVSKIKFENLTSTVDIMLRAQTGGTHENLRDTISRWRAGDPIKILFIGDSLTCGTGAYSGPRSAFKSITGAYGLSYDAVGPLTTQTGSLEAWGARDYEHAGVGGETLAQITARVGAAVTTYDPDLIIANGGSNDMGSLTQAQFRTAVQTFFTTARTAKPNVPVIFWGPPPKNNGGAISMDGGQTPCHWGLKEGCQGVNDVMYIDMHAALARQWSVFWHSGVDSTHYNEIGYTRVAMVLAKCILGLERSQQVYQAHSVTTGSAISADIQIPDGGLIQASGGTINVVTWGGQNVSLIFGTSVPVNTPFETPICFIRSSASALSTNNFWVHRYSPGGLL